MSPYRINNPAPAHEALSAIKNSLTKGTGDLFPWQPVAIALGILLLFAGIYQLVRMLRKPGATKSMKRTVFTALADELGLSIRQQWLLVRVAQQQALPTALALLLSADTYTHHSRKYVQHLPPKAGEVANHQLDAIRRRVFLGEQAATASPA